MIYPIKVGTVLNTKKGLYLVFDILDQSHFSVIDWETQKKIELIHIEHVLEIIDLPSNVKSFFVKKCDKVANDFFQKRGW